MFKKLLITLLLVFICCGCDIRYSINTEKDIQEEFEISNYIINYSDELFMSPFEAFSQQYAYSSYASTITDRIFNKSYNDFNEFMETSALFDLVNTNDYIKVDGKKVKIKFPTNALNNENLANYGKIDKLEVSIYVPYFVSKNNADKVINHNYIWEIDDILNDEVIINFDMSKPYDFLSKLFLTIFLIALAISAIFVIKYFIGRHKEANRI